MRSLPISSTQTPRKALIAAGLLCGLFALLSILLGPVSIPPKELVGILAAGPQNTPASRIVWYARLPRTAACLLAGAALAAAGTILQNVLANPMASPGIIGVNAGAGLAVTVCCIFTGAGWAVSGAAFLGAAAAAALIVLLAQKTGASRMTVILSGVAVNSLLNSASEALGILFRDAGANSADFRVGGFSAVSIPRLLPAGCAILLGLGLVLSLTSEMELLSMGEAAAGGLGLPVRRTRTLLLGLAALLAGASVSFCGLLGFVGLLVPHMARHFVRSNSAWLLPMSALCGAALVTLCDLAARLVFAPYELPAGILLSFLGGPFFILLLLRQRGGRIHG